MKADLSIAELLALIELADEHVDRNLGSVDPPRFLREVQQKLDTIVLRHQSLESEPQPKKKAKAAKEGL